MLSPGKPFSLLVGSCPTSASPVAVFSSLQEWKNRFLLPPQSTIKPKPSSHCVLICQWRIIIVPSSLHSCRNEMRSGMFPDGAPHGCSRLGCLKPFRRLRQRQWYSGTRSCGHSLAVLELLVGGHLLIGRFYSILAVILGYLVQSLFLQLSIIN